MPITLLSGWLQLRRSVRQNHLSGGAPLNVSMVFYHLAFLDATRARVYLRRRTYKDDCQDTYILESLSTLRTNEAHTKPKILFEIVSLWL